MAKGGETGERGRWRYVENLVLQLPIRILRLLPYRLRIPAMGWVMSRVVAPLAGWRKRIRDNLKHVFPDLPEAEIRRIVLAVPDNAGRAMMEMYSAREFTERIAKIEIPPCPALDAVAQAHKAGQPVIFVTGHFGNYDAPRAWFLSRGYPVGALYNPMRNGYFNDHYVEALTEVGSPTFPRGRAGMGDMLRHLRKGGMLGLVIDQYMSHGVLLDFLGKPAPTALSAAEMALKYKALIVPIYGIRKPDGLNFEIHIEPPLEGDDPRALTQALNDSLSAVVRDHIGQWFWIHRRWKPERHKKFLAREEA